APHRGADTRASDSVSTSRRRSSTHTTATSRSRASRTSERPSPFGCRPRRSPLIRRASPLTRCIERGRMRMGASDSDRNSFHAGLAIADRYRLVERLGTGGMGAVWRATHMTLAHDVAIKFLQVHDVSNDARARFEREAKLAARLGEASRHITRVIDY